MTLSFKDSIYGQEVLEDEISDSSFTKPAFTKHFFLSHSATLSAKPKPRFGQECSLEKPSASLHLDPFHLDALDFPPDCRFSWSLKQPHVISPQIADYWPSHTNSSNRVKIQLEKDSGMSDQMRQLQKSDSVLTTFVPKFKDRNTKLFGQLLGKTLFIKNTTKDTKMYSVEKKLLFSSRFSVIF